ncbi:hypothetical protein [Streptomyces sp. NBC_01565]|uniref:hypothetical protein n=1 Tax=unclassified Streptomyces TaxID=2593676 RepID=UPI0022548D03|nr:hypothetical protein [Streptomyces sp. NBC_01565]MCX4539581.1 DUF4097 domain-containing protein [Streptomyces sp. NBC_01565]
MSGPSDAGRPAPPRPGHRRAWIIAALLSAVFVVTPVTWQLLAYGATQSRVLYGGSGGRPVTAVEIVGGDANVTVTPRSDREVGYRAEVSWSLGAPAIEESWLGDSLRLTPHCSGGAGLLSAGVGCSVELGVTVPVGIPVKVTAGAGQVAVKGLGGSVDANVGSGTLTLTGLRGALRAEVGSGSLVATDVTSAQADVRVGSGRGEVAFITPPQRVTARAGSGRVLLTVPAASRFRVGCEEGPGRCEVPEALRDPASDRVLDIAVNSGRAQVGYPDPMP